MTDCDLEYYFEKIVFATLNLMSPCNPF